MDSACAALGTGHRDITVLGGSPIRSTTPDQVSVSGVLESGAVASIFYRGGLSRAGDFRWEINGTDGDLLVTSAAPNGNVQAIELRVAGGRASDRHVAALTTPEDAAGNGLPNPARNVAALYAAFARDLAEGSTVAPSFADAVQLHRLIEQMARGASTAGLKMTTDTEETPCALQS